MKNIPRILFIFIVLFLVLLLFMNIKGTFNESLSNEIITSRYEDNDERGWIPVADIEISNVDESIIALLSLPTLKDNYYLDMPIKNGVELDILATSIGHFEKTRLINGNICLVAHNSGTNKKGEYVGYFDRIKDLKIGDEIIYKYLNNTYSYKVISNEIISEKDLSVLNDKNDNRLTLITCVKGPQNRLYRRCVVATRE